MIVRRAGLREGKDCSREWLYYSDEGQLTQFGAYVEMLEPGGRSSDQHWHEKEDEFLYVLTGEVTVIEDGVDNLLLAGDSACWPAGQPTAHSVENRSQMPCTYMIMGTRVTHDVCHYPESGRILHTEGEQWRLESADGEVLQSGQCKSPPDRD